MVHFSKELVQRYKKCMQEVYQAKVSDEQAQLDLASLSRPYLLFTEDKQND